MAALAPMIACPSCGAPSTRVVELELDKKRAKLRCRVCSETWYEAVSPLPTDLDALAEKPDIG